MDQREGENANCRVGGAVSIGPSGETPGSRSQLYLDRNTYLHGQQSPKCLCRTSECAGTGVRGSTRHNQMRHAVRNRGWGLGKMGLKVVGAVYVPCYHLKAQLTARSRWGVRSSRERRLVPNAPTHVAPIRRYVHSPRCLSHLHLGFWNLCLGASGISTRLNNRVRM